MFIRISESRIINADHIIEINIQREKGEIVVDEPDETNPRKVGSFIGPSIVITTIERFSDGDNLGNATVTLNSDDSCSFLRWVNEGSMKTFSPGTKMLDLRSAYRPDWRDKVKVEAQKRTNLHAVPMVFTFECGCRWGYGVGHPLDHECPSHSGPSARTISPAVGDEATSPMRRQFLGKKS